MKTRPTIADVASAAGVSMATVSKAVNNRYGVSAGTRASVLRAVQELGYQSSIAASGMRTRQPNAIGVLVAGFEPFSAEVLKGVGTGLCDSGMEILAYSPAGQSDQRGWEQRSLARIAGSLVAGAIIVTPTVVDVRSEIPVVAIDPDTGRGDLPVVESDNFDGGRLATAHLIDLGHRRIAFLAGRADLRSSMLREAGYRHALEAAGIDFDPSLLGEGNFDTRSSREPAARLLAHPDPPTAIFAGNDLSAIGVIEVALARGLKMPRDLSVIGFDDVPEAARLMPPLTTVRQSMQGMGAAAAELVLRLLGGEPPQPARIMLPTRLITRSTTAAPRLARSGAAGRVRSGS